MSASTPPIHALVVEDDPSWQQILTEILADQGLAVDVYATAEQAISGLHKQFFRLAIVDLSLVGGDHTNQDGLKVLEALHRSSPGSVAILLTGFASVELAVSVLQQYGAYTCLRKETFRRAAFRQMISQALAASPAERPETPAAIPKPQVDYTQPAEKLSEALSQRAPLALVVEDDAGWRQLLAELLNEAGLQTQLSASYGEALGLLKRQQFVLAVADLSLANSMEPEGNLDGYRLLASTRQARIPTLVVSGRASLELVEQAYSEQGVFACLEKQRFDRSVFLNTVEEALSAGAPQADPAFSSLSDREIEVLALVAQGMTNKEIAAELYITTNTVKRHLKSIFEKLDVSTRAAASARAIRMGVSSPMGESTGE